MSCRHLISGKNHLVIIFQHLDDFCLPSDELILTFFDQLDLFGPENFIRQSHSDGVARCAESFSHMKSFKNSLHKKETSRIRE